MKKTLLLLALLMPIVLSAQTRKFSEIVTDGDTITELSSDDFIYVIEDPLGTPDSKAIRSTAFVLSSDGVSAANDLPLLTDTIPAYTFGAGSGLTGDTALFVKDAHGFGMFNTMNDTTVCFVDVLRISSGDGLIFNMYWGNGMTLTATDSLFNSPESTTTSSGSLTVDDAKIPPNQDVWIELKADQTLTTTPNEVVIQLSKQIIRD